jgi:membrane-associated phospholipid phosphatase
MEIIKFLQAFSTPFLDNFFELATMLGEEAVYIAIIGVLYWCYNKKMGYRLAFAFLFSGVVNGGLKNIFKLPRPIGVEGIKSIRVETATGYAFPSGHTQGTAGFWAAAMLKYKKIPLYIIGATIILLVGISRVYLGVHWPRDVFGGIVFGVLSAAAANHLFDYSEKHNNKHILSVLVVPSLLGLLFFGHSSDYVKAVAVACSFYVGYVIEDKHIRFTEKSEPLKQILKFILGMLGILVIKIFVKDILPVNALGYFIRYFMLGIWTTICAPCLFKVLKLQSVKAETMPTSL